MRVTPRGIIFDYGKVLARPQLPADVAAMASLLGLPPALFSEMYWRFRAAYDAGRLDPPAYWTRVAEAASRRLTAPQIDQLNEIDGLSWSHPAPVMPEWAQAIRTAGLRTALLSNMPLTVRQAVERSGWLPEFDDCTFSCDVGISKPAPEIYWHSLHGLGLEPPDVLFLDDRPANIRGAQALGMHTLQFTTPDAAAVEIKQRFVLPVPLSERIDQAAGEPLQRGNR